MKENKIIMVGIFFLLFFSSSFVGLNDFFYQTSGKDKASFGLLKEEKVLENEPLPLECTVYDYYANGEIVNRGSSSNPLPRITSKSSHPITKNEFQLINLDEFVILPIPVEPAILPVLYQDSGLNFDGWHIYPESVSIYSELTKGFTSDLALGDVDGDGYDELNIATDSNNILIYDDAQHAYLEIGNHLVSESITYYSMYKAITTGDVDGDGLDEIIYVRLVGMIYVPGQGYQFSVLLWVYDVFPVWNRICYTTVVTDYHTESDIFNGYYYAYNFMMEPEVTSGDFDGDGLDEIAFAYSFKETSGTKDLWVLDDYKHNFNRICNYDVFNEGDTGDIDLSSGDFDGDGVDEIAYAGCPWNGEQLEGQLAIIDEISLIPKIEKLLKIEAPGGVWVNRLPVACGDVDGDGRDEIGVVRSYRENYPGDFFLYEYLPATGKYALKTKKEKDFMDFGLAMGDVDCDGMAEMVFAGRFYMGVLDDATHNYAQMMSNLAYGGLVACGDADGDGLRLRYTGESWQNTAPPGMITVMAAPPLYESIDQNYLSSYTAFGQVTSSGTEISWEIGTSVSTTISYEQTLDWGIFEVLKFSWSHTIGKELARTDTITKTLIKTVNYATGWSDDAVIYHSTDYSSYKYQIIHHPFDSSVIGRNITIDVPNPPTIIPVTLSYFDSKYNYTIGSETFNHTAGQPWTYLTRNESAVVAPVRWASGEEIVGQGSGFSRVAIEVAEETSSEMKTSEFSDYSWGVAVCGAGFSKSSSIFSSKAFEITVGKATVYEGCVGFIANNKTWEKLKYTFNMIVYYQDHPDGSTYQVINYYVEGAIPIDLKKKVGFFFQENWPWVAGIGGGLIGLTTVTFSVIAAVKHGKQKPTTSKKNKKIASSKTAKSKKNRKASSSKKAKRKSN